MASMRVPRLPKRPLDPFVRLANDLSFVGEFMSGEHPSCRPARLHAEFAKRGSRRV